MAFLSFLPIFSCDAITSGTLLVTDGDYNLRRLASPQLSTDGRVVVPQRSLSNNVMAFQSIVWKNEFFFTADGLYVQPVTAPPAVNQPIPIPMTGLPNTSKTNVTMIGYGNRVYVLFEDWGRLGYIENRIFTVWSPSASNPAMTNFRDIFLDGNFLCWHNLQPGSSLLQVDLTQTNASVQSIAVNGTIDPTAPFTIINQNGVRWFVSFVAGTGDLVRCNLALPTQIFVITGVKAAMTKRPRFLPQDTSTAMRNTLMIVGRQPSIITGSSGIKDCLWVIDRSQNEWTLSRTILIDSPLGITSPAGTSTVTSLLPTIDNSGYLSLLYTPSPPPPRVQTLRYDSLFGIYSKLFEYRLDIGPECIKAIPPGKGSWGARLTIQRADGGPNVGPVCMNHVVGIFARNPGIRGTTGFNVRLDIGTACVQKKQEITNATPSSQLLIESWDPAISNNRKEVHYGDVIHIISSDRRYELDIGTISMKKDQAATWVSWATVLVFGPPVLNGNSKVVPPEDATKSFAISLRVNP